jgi:hypothetical protein
MLFNVLFWGITLGMVGKLLLGITVITVHSHILREQRIDTDVIRAMRRERKLALMGVIFIVIGYFLEAVHFGILPF